MYDHEEECSLRDGDLSKKNDKSEIALLLVYNGSLKLEYIAIMAFMWFIWKSYDNKE